MNKMRHTLAFAALSSASAVGCSSSLYLNYNLESREDDDAWTFHGGGCSLDDGGSSASGGGGDRYEISISSDDGVTRFTAIVDGEVVEKRVLDRSFLKSGKKEVVTVALPNGRTERYTFWGSSTCEGPEWPDAGMNPSEDADSEVPELNSP